MSFPWLFYSPVFGVHCSRRSVNSCKLFFFVFLSTFMSCVCRWWPPWAGRGTPNTSCALTARRRSAPETSLSATASRTASRTTTTCSLHAATTATGPFWTCVPVALWVLPPAVSRSEDPATVTAVCVCVFRKWWRPWIGRGILSTSSVLSVDLFLDQKVTMSSHWQLLLCVNIPDVVKSSGRNPEWMNSTTRSDNAGLQLSSVWVYISMLVLARKYFIRCSFTWTEGFCLWSCEGFHEKDGKAYCRKDYFDMFAPKCGGCARAILENYISALSRLWHPECFVCRVSNQITEQPSVEGRTPALQSAAGVRSGVTEVTLRLWSAGVLHPVCERQFLRARGPAVLWDSLPRAPRLALLWLQEAHHGPLHHRHGQEVSPGALCVRLLPEAAQQRNVQRAEREAVLSRLLHQALQSERGGRGLIRFVQLNPVFQKTLKLQYVKEIFCFS